MNIYDILCMPLAEIAPLAMVITFAFIFGSCLGSFLNVCIWRIPLGESVVIVPSHCPKCNHKIRWFDNVPVIGFLALKGKCRDCKEPISPRYIIMELLVGLLFTFPAILIYMNSGRLQDLIALTIILSVAVPCAFIDIEYRKLPDKLTYFGMIAGTLYNWLFLGGAPFKAASLLWSLQGLLAGVIGLGVFAWIQNFFPAVLSNAVPIQLSAELKALRTGRLKRGTMNTAIRKQSRSLHGTDWHLPIPANSHRRYGSVR